MRENPVLILTDDLRRGREIASDLSLLTEWIAVRLVTDAADDFDAALVVSDIAFSRPSSIAGLRARLARAASPVRAHVCVIRRDTPHDRAQANALGASSIVNVKQRAEGLRAGLAPFLPRRAAPKTQPSVAASRAMTDLLEAARSGGFVPPALADKGAEVVRKALDDVAIRGWLEFVWRFDDATHQHCMLVAGLAAAFASTLGFSRSDTLRLTRGALLHDIGKARIPIEILNKPGSLTQAEWTVMRTHAPTGFELLAGQGYDDETLAIVRSHHELLDGSGYPDGLRGDAIADVVRLVTICDIFAALIEKRPYRRAISCEEAYGILSKMDGKLDRDLVRAFKPVALASGEPAFARAAGRG
ncbi:HD-GYP domain-containing protein [Hansschlegelia quercus]|nr:HD domain-containing phosphohydrolase [Hansschlegelia quercus]